MVMMEFLAAVLLASLLGSLHCVGMCGPMALWATNQNRSPLVGAAYHVGRLSTYLSAGLMAGVIGSTLRISGEVVGFQQAAAKVAGILLALIGISQIVRRTRWWSRRLELRNTAKNRHDRSGKTLVAGWLHGVRPMLTSQGPIGRAYLGGLVTTWLPCGWLYLFVLAAGGTGQVSSSLAVMFAFWIGTLPALVGVVYGANVLATRFRGAIPTVTSLLLIATGFYTATGRAAADLTTLNPETLNAETKTTPAAGRSNTPLLPPSDDGPLPCCSGGQQRWVEWER